MSRFLQAFPTEPVMPGVLIIEAMAQVGAIVILSQPEMKGKIAFFGGVNKARFRNKVVPEQCFAWKWRLLSKKDRLESVRLLLTTVTRKWLKQSLHLPLANEVS